LCKHQSAVAAKYHVESLNFFSSLMPNDRAHFAYIACAIDMNVDKIVSDIDTNHILATNINLNEIVSDVDTNQIAATEV
ncbi:10317_t:CDS:2, partial [Racocetra persica]